MFIKHACLILGMVAFAGGFSGVVAAEPLARLDPTDTIDEQLRPDALISGNWLVGIHTMAEPAPSVPTLYSYVPSGWNGELVCVRVTDQEGRYTALYEYRMPDDWEGGLAEFIYPTGYADHVKTINESNSGVALHKGDCATVSDIFVPVQWNALEQPIDTAPGVIELVLNVNAGRADSVFGEGTLANGPTIKMDCTPTTARGVGFNYKCTLEVPGNQGTKLDIVVNRLRFGRAAPPRTATIELFPLLAE